MFSDRDVYSTFVNRTMSGVVIDAVPSVEVGGYGESGEIVEDRMIAGMVMMN